MGHNDKIALARFRISTLELIIEDVQCDDSYLYVSGIPLGGIRISTSTTPTMTQTAIRKLVADSIAATLEEVANIA
ncbi:hypothetical protein Tco_1201604 [Tanacetum coccineum]